MAGPQHCYALVRDWLGETEAVDRDRALPELARRYLVGHGPADERDLAKWAGITLGDAREGLNAIVSELEQRPDGTVDLARRGPVADLPPPRLLGSFDPLLLGWRSREPVLAGHTSLVTRNGLFRPFLLVGGRAVGTWRLVTGKVAIEPFGPLRSADAAALQADAAAVERYLA
jgi:hypothetical protein